MAAAQYENLACTIQNTKYEDLARIGKKLKLAPIWKSQVPVLNLDGPRSTLNGKRQDDKGGTVMPNGTVWYDLWRFHMVRYGTICCTESSDMGGTTMPYFRPGFAKEEHTYME